MSASPPRPPSLRRNAFVNLVGRGTSLLVWILVTPFALARLGPERFGIWSLFFTLTSYAAALDLGMASGTPRFIAARVAHGDRAGARHVLVRSLALAVSIGGLWIVVCLLGQNAFVRAFHVPAPWVTEAKASLGWFGGALFAFTLSQVFQGVLVGFQRLDLSNLWFAAGLAANVTLLVVGLSFGLGLRAVAFGSLIGALVTATFSAISVQACLVAVPIHGQTKRTGWRELLGFSGTVQMTNAFNVAQLQIGKVLLGMLDRLSSVAQYELGFRVANAVWSIPTLVQAAMFPAAAHAHALDSTERIRQIYDWGCRWVFALGGWVFGALWVTAPALLRLWLGSTIDSPVLVARGLTVAFALATLAGPATMIARGAGWPRIETAFFGLAAVLNLALSAWWVPPRGASGAVLATVLSFGIAMLIVIPVLHRRVGVSTLRWLGRSVAPRLLPALIAAAVMTPFVRGVVRTRGEALASVCISGLAFTSLYALLLLPSGDPRTVWVSGRTWLAGAARTRRSAA